MSERKWTPQQNNAIYARGGSLLISASAGAGKTAVLVERVISRITEKENPLDADQFVIATFSNAAADELKQRIGAALDQLIFQHPGELRFSRQKMLLSRAHIGTVHSFCFHLIQEHFQEIGLPAHIKIGDEKELELLKYRAVQAVLEECYGENEEAFRSLVELFSNTKGDKQFVETIMQLYHFVRSHPFYEDWMQEKLQMYDPAVPLEQSVWVVPIFHYAEDALLSCEKQYQSALEEMQYDEGMKAAYLQTFQQEKKMLESLLQLVQRKNWNGVYQTLRQFSFERLKALRNCQDEELKNFVLSTRTRLKNTIAKLTEHCFVCNTEEYTQDVEQLYPMVEKLFAITMQFSAYYDQLKLERKWVDFSDIEHYALKLLLKKEGQKYQKTQIAQMLSAQFGEILIDEYQDTNEVQDYIFKAISKEETNLFMVGDAKQSIYRFRQAMPELFMEKRAKFYPYDGKHYPATISLNDNFRSRKEITAVINHILNCLMTEKVGEIDYQKEQLVSAAAFPPYKNCGVEIHVVQRNKESNLSKMEEEAEQIAKSIYQMVENGYFVNDNGNMRKANYGDFAILLRSQKDKTDLLAKALNRYHIDVWVDKQEGFLRTKEIAPVISLLRVIDNPLLDVALVSCMMSPLFCFTADEIAAIRLEEKDVAFYVALLKKAETGDQKCKNFLQMLSSFRLKVPLLSCDKLIQEIYDQTDYLSVMSMTEAGESRVANLHLLMDYARSYESGTNLGLSGFVNYLTSLYDMQSDLSAASILPQGVNAVKIMSIHRSKGLEFPIVILADTTKSFNKRDLYNQTILNSKMGFACIAKEKDGYVKHTTVPLQAIRLEHERAMISEELRILYVALTRAKEKLIISAAADQIEKKLDTLQAVSKITPHTVLETSNYFDWILMALLPYCNKERTLITLKDDIAIPIKIFTVNFDSEKQPQVTNTVLQVDTVLQQKMKQNMQFEYPFLEDVKIPTKLGVSDMVKEENNKTHYFTKRLRSLYRQGLTGSEKGNAIHKFMQFSNFALAKQNLTAEIKRLVQLAYISPEEAESIDRAQLKSFFDSALYDRIQSADKVYRELRFIYEADDSLMNRYQHSAAGSDIKTMIQGVADCVIVENGKGVIVDYKTDLVKDAESLALRYQDQLLVYGKILSESLNIPITELIIYSFTLKKQINLLT